MQSLAENFLQEAKVQVAEMTAHINATAASASDPKRKAIVFQRKRLMKIIPHLELLLSSYQHVSCLKH